MWFYYLIFLLLLGFCLYNFKQKDILLYLLGGLLIIIAAFRGDVSVDHSNYTFMFSHALRGEVVGEPSFQAISGLLGYFNLGIGYLYFIYAVIAIPLKIVAIKRLSDFWLYSLLLYFSYYFFLHDMTQIRAGVATGFVLLSIPYIVERRSVSFITFIGLATLFHYSAIFFLPFYFLNSKKLNSYFFLLIPLAYILYFLGLNLVSLMSIIDIDIVTRKYEAYKSLATIDRINVLNVVQLVRIGIIALLFFYWRLLSEHSRFAVILTKLYVLSLFFLVIFADIPAIAFRISELFATVEFLLIPMFIHLFRQKASGEIAVASFGLAMLSVILIYEKLMLPYFNF